MAAVLRLNFLAKSCFRNIKFLLQDTKSSSRKSQQVALVNCLKLSCYPLIRLPCNNAATLFTSTYAKVVKPAQSCAIFEENQTLNQIFKETTSKSCLSKRELHQSRVKMAPITLYGIDLSPPFRSVLITAKIVGVELDIKRVDFHKNETLTESFRQINPNHSVPAINDNGLIIWESRAIMTYLVQQYGKDDQLYPKDITKRTVVDNMLHFDNTNFSTLQLLQMRPARIYGKKATPDSVERIKDRLQILDIILSKNKFAAGDQVTLADISMLTTLGLAVALKNDMDSYRNIARYLAETPSKIPHFEEVNKKGYEELKSYASRLLETIK